jgi:hypothetical protein
LKFGAVQCCRYVSVRAGCRSSCSHAHSFRRGWCGLPAGFDRLSPNGETEP